MNRGLVVAFFACTLACRKPPPTTEEAPPRRETTSKSAELIARDADAPPAVDAGPSLATRLAQLAAKPSLEKFSEPPCFSDESHCDIYSYNIEALIAPTLYRVRGRSRAWGWHFRSKLPPRTFLTDGASWTYIFGEPAKTFRITGGPFDGWIVMDLVEHGGEWTYSILTPEEIVGADDGFEGKELCDLGFIDEKICALGEAK